MRDELALVLNLTMENIAVSAAISTHNNYSYEISKMYFDTVTVIPTVNCNCIKIESMLVLNFHELPSIQLHSN